MSQKLDVTFEYSDLTLTMSVMLTGNWGEKEYIVKVVRVEPTNDIEFDLYEMSVLLKKDQAKIEQDAIYHYSELLKNYE